MEKNSENMGGGSAKFSILPPSPQELKWNSLINIIQEHKNDSSLF